MASITHHLECILKEPYSCSAAPSFFFEFASTFSSDFCRAIGMSSAFWASSSRRAILEAGIRNHQGSKMEQNGGFILCCRQQDGRAHAQTPRPKTNLTNAEKAQKGCGPESRCSMSSGSAAAEQLQECQCTVDAGRCDLRTSLWPMGSLSAT